MEQNRNRGRKGFSFLEMMIVISSIGILSALALSFFGGLRENAERQKLESDVQSINSAAKMFLSNGGDFGDFTDPQSVLDLMKSAHSDAMRQQIAGLTGSTIDKRLSVRLGTAEEGEPIARWNATTQRFEVVDDGGAGIVEFVFDDSLAEVDYGTGGREESALTYNDKPGWVWAYSDTAAPPPPGPSVVSTSSVPSTSPPAPPGKLAPPVYSIPSGSFDESDLPLSVSLANPNPSSTWIMYSVDGGPYVTYSGPIQVTAATTIFAYVDGDPSTWIESGKQFASYTVNPPPPPSQLNPPTISLTSDSFSDTITEIAVAIANPNPAGSSTLYYSLIPSDGSHAAQSTWTRYVGPISATSADYPAGFQVAAYARSDDAKRYIDSTITTEFATVEFFEIPVVGNVLFIVDASLSMNEAFGTSTRFGVTVERLMEVIEDLPPNIRFSVVTFANELKWSDGSFELKQATKSNKEDMIDAVESIRAEGGGTAYLEALNIPEMFSPLPDQVIFLSDGVPRDTGFLAKTAALSAMGIRIDTIGLDFASGDVSPLEEIAALAGGKYVAIKE